MRRVSLSKVQELRGSIAKGHSHVCCCVYVLPDNESHQQPQLKIKYVQRKEYEDK
jgi:hypothetical protein